MVTIFIYFPPPHKFYKFKYYLLQFHKKFYTVKQTIIKNKVISFIKQIYNT